MEFEIDCSVNGLCIGKIVKIDKEYEFVPSGVRCTTNDLDNVVSMIQYLKDNS